MNFRTLIMKTRRKKVAKKSNPGIEFNLPSAIILCCHPKWVRWREPEKSILHTRNSKWNLYILDKLKWNLDLTFFEITVCVWFYIFCCWCLLHLLLLWWTQIFCSWWMNVEYIVGLGIILASHPNCIVVSFLLVLASNCSRLISIQQKDNGKKWWGGYRNRKIEERQRRRRRRRRKIEFEHHQNVLRQMSCGCTFFATFFAQNVHKISKIFRKLVHKPRNEEWN